MIYTRRISRWSDDLSRSDLIVVFVLWNMCKYYIVNGKLSRWGSWVSGGIFLLALYACPAADSKIDQVTGSSQNARSSSRMFYWLPKYFWCGLAIRWFEASTQTEHLMTLSRLSMVWERQPIVLDQIYLWLLNCVCLLIPFLISITCGPNEWTAEYREWLLICSRWIAWLTYDDDS